MVRRTAVCFLALAALAAAPAAAGDGPMPFAMQGGSGVLAANGLTRFVPVGTSTQSSTALEVISTEDGTVKRSVDLAGWWGVPVVTPLGSGEGLSADGKTLVLGDVVTSYPHTESRFLVVGTRSLLVRRTIQLKGDFAFDAISPHARRLYLIQHVDSTDTTKYVVRSYDLATGRLLPGRIADRTQKGWVMRGYPTSRATSADGRWVYTLYQPLPGGFPFVHALDTVRGVAHCIGLPWRGSVNGLYNMRVSLHSGGKTLAVHWLSGRPWLTVNTNTWQIEPDRRGGFPWTWTAGTAAAVTLLAGAALLLRRRRSREEFEQELVELLRFPERKVVV